MTQMWAWLCLQNCYDVKRPVNWKCSPWNNSPGSSSLVVHCMWNHNIVCNVCRCGSGCLRGGGKATWECPEGLLFLLLLLLLERARGPWSCTSKQPFPLYQLLPQSAEAFRTLSLQHSFKNQSMQIKNATPQFTVINGSKQSWRQKGMLSRAWNLSSRAWHTKIRSLRLTLNA